MSPVEIVAAGAVSAFGAGPAAYSVGEVGDEARTAIAPDAELQAMGFRRPFLARAPCDPALLAEHGDRAAALLAASARELLSMLDRVWPDWRSRRVGLSVGTSSGGMLSLVEVLRRRERGERIEPRLARASPYFGPLHAMGSVLRVRPVERIQVLAACASSAVALGIACRWLEQGRVDLVIAGGYDAVSPFVAAGFESLGATTASAPAPFCQGRDGMALGEGAALVALAPRGAAREPLGALLGFGASADAVHVTAPDRTGAGLAAAARGALSDAGLPGDAVDLVSAHGTATPFNDAAEAKAIQLLLPDGAAAPPVHAFKAALGHTLGASALLELLAALDAMRRGILPGTAGLRTPDPEAPARLLPRNAPGTPRVCVKLSAAFGGANAALVATALPEGAVVDTAARLASAPVGLLALGASRTALDVDRVLPATRMERQRLLRVDPLSALAIAALEDALGRIGPVPAEKTGVILGSASATLENNEAFDARLRARGPRGVEPRRFPGTSPNLPAGQCSIAFGLRGPTFAVAASAAAATEALVVAHDLLAAGDADYLAVIAAEDVGPVVRDIWEAAGWPAPQHGAVAAILARGAGIPLERQRLSALHESAEADGGRVRGVAPGWPSLVAALTP